MKHLPYAFLFVSAHLLFLLEARGPPRQLRIPVVEALSLPAEDMTTLTLVEESFQPLVVPGSLQYLGASAVVPGGSRKPGSFDQSRDSRSPEGNLRPWWFFDGLETSIEAATTFCVVEVEGVNGRERKRRTGTKEIEDDILGGERGDEGESEGKGVKERKEKEKNGDERKSERKQSKGKSKQKKKGKTEKRENEGKETRERTKPLEMSLRRFVLEGSRRWSHAVTNITKEIGESLTVPKLLVDTDFEFLDMKRTHLHHARSGWGGHVVEHEGHAITTAVVCVMEGHLRFLLSPFAFQWDSLQCSADECLLQVPDVEATDEGRPELFLSRALLLPGTCFYMPLGWQWQVKAEGDTTFLWLAWQDDLVLRDDVTEALFPPDDHDGGAEGTEGHVQEIGSAGVKKDAKKGPPKLPATLWEILPTDPSPPLVLWGEQNPLPHILSQYLLSDLQLSFGEFYERFRIDRVLLPDLVDCSSECQSLAASVFHLLDTSADGLLNQLDAIHLTQASVRSLTLQLDDLLDELKDIGMEQWVDVVQGDAGKREAFLGRAKDRMVSSAQSQVKRWIDGELEGVDEEDLKEHLPELYSQVIAAREAEAGKDEL
ncbi:uncharacterized protein LOC122248874 [Penaeus japonicus]|uniref:uncharacterized protein LOC122248874 n=1 Tax=Penaeus japonicus TaxID=27405 RepID=UPI001C70ED60|nr:uncharacterized protein LOC122248874 [Penaeus japonicus]